MFRNITYKYYDEDEYENIIKGIINQFRKSLEYKLWLDIYNRDKCAGTGLSKSFDGVEIELHHFSLTLWDWVELIISAFDEEDLPFNSFVICNVLADLHLSSCVPCVPLSKDTHKQIHNDYENTIFKYPDILKNLNEGNILEAKNIINYHIKIYKNIFNEEQRLKDNE